MKHLHRIIAPALLAAGLHGTAHAKLVEQQFDLPVHVANAWGKVVEQPIRVTVYFNDATPAPRPIVLINHGRAVDADGRAALGRARFPEASRWFAERGFLVAVPTRIGYGVSGGEDVEDSGSCNNRLYPPVFRAAADQSLQLLDVLRQRDDVVKDRTVLLGQSFGGATTVTLASLNPAGVVTAINFAGGGGGDPKAHPEQPCSPVQLRRMFAGYGQTAHVPMLWAYTENDRFFGATLPREWVQAFRDAGGQAEFKQFPPHGEDGHLLFAKFPQVWQPVVADFLRRQGFDIKD
ncbi:dienelactone hydrolase family protein [Roseateles cellulosilyticus]|uniref:Dienelactone hydrolase family protein n=1 Tax=Pelomonas cellulosilytica TaxID=2906762 RepID=A0ABS8XXC1_9BURK|nr:dienelactone hydrolase family protein [Pelomonas sp. P8]MCE4557299.1 dienelactone hydrolase family protein [Pelomonas sp. P8]